MARRRRQLAADNDLASVFGSDGLDRFREMQDEVQREFGDSPQFMLYDPILPLNREYNQVQNDILDNIRLTNNGMFLANGTEEVQEFAGGGAGGGIGGYIPGQPVEEYISENTMAPMATSTISHQGGMRQRIREEVAQQVNPTVEMAQRRRNRLVAAYSTTDLAWALYYLEHNQGVISLDDVERVLSVWGGGGYSRPWEGGFIVELKSGKVGHLACTVGYSVDPWVKGDYRVTYEEGQHILDLSIPADVNLKEDPADLNRWLKDPNREPIAYDIDG